MTTTHVAGPGFCYKGRIIQRCAVCGEKLIDVDTSHVYVPEYHEAKGVLLWEEAMLIRVDGNCQYSLGQYLAAEEMPDDFCITLVEK